ncbi:LacI family transcriptional regulator [Glycomyces sp. TRM65418]|uniref:LacI family DNA-binding transcriptional regulator n=1 Tax=Glycomyces sp. TRM65418 TaxID=2867006 RepID=UPI001CE5D695|nr:LacI family DNA-binding transcriptional regulator [Glycomyces sp. TRM65418]MCC3765970.1 LacI family transcriptional regulator [Glycomyces sp. TRM65418]QZD55550.1 LacI family transcriptional regulator [Glycomyces sp. TRM65418]
MTRKRPTINDVAEASGVSRGTVSRVLNGQTNVSLAAELAVRRAVSETGYVVNRAARSLKTSRTGSVVMVLSEPQERLFEDPNFSVLMRAATNRLAERDMSLVLMIAGDDGDRERVAHYLRGGHADGALLISTHEGDPLLEAVERSHVPAVACGAVLGHESVIPYAAADDRGGARQAAQYLVDQGRRRIGMITGPLDTPGGALRMEGFTSVLGRKVTKRKLVYGDYTQAGGERAMHELLRNFPDLDAVFVASDLMAAGALQALRTAGRRVPGDVAVVGFDDSAIATATNPMLTTIRQPLAEVAEETVRLLIALLDEQQVESAVLPTELIVRDSA